MNSTLLLVLVFVLVVLGGLVGLAIGLLIGLVVGSGREMGVAQPLPTAAKAEWGMAASTADQEPPPPAQPVEAAPSPPPTAEIAYLAQLPAATRPAQWWSVPLAIGIILICCLCTFLVAVAARYVKPPA